MTLQKLFRTYEQICLDKLKEIGISSAGEWAIAMGYGSPNGLAKIIKRIKKTTPDKLKVYYGRKPIQYEAL